MLEISGDLKAHITRRQWARLWGQKSMIRPVFIETALGNGDQLVAIVPLNTRPNYYLIRVDSKWSLRNTDDGDCLYEHIEEIEEAIEDECGRKYETNDDGDEVEMPWPALDCDSGVSWSTAMDLIPAAAPSHKDGKE